MPFRVMARTLLHLGAELISSDGVAFYELIKNAFDAASNRATINVVVRIPHAEYVSARAAIADARESWGARGTDEAAAVGGLATTVTSAVDLTAPGSTELIDGLRAAHTWDALDDLVSGANFIDVIDKGEGMSVDDLNEAYLTIGTRSRLRQRGAVASGAPGAANRPVLGEKGIGRLAVLRLGQRLHVRTSRGGEERWNILDVDWHKFSHASDAYIEDIEVRPVVGPVKDDPAASGTTIHISDLSAVWSRPRLAEVTEVHFSRLTDPFTPSKRYPVITRFNGEVVPVPALSTALFAADHARVEARFDPAGDGACLSGRIQYRLRGREQTFARPLAELISITSATPAVLRALGTFRIELHWYNRRVLEAVDGIGDRTAVKALVARWAGGPMLFRDGFRVNPYGNAEDDWLDLDRLALAASGYKVNRRQIIGKVDIGSASNPMLVDQTNREGLRECPEKAALVRVLQHVLNTELRTFLNNVDEEARAKEPLYLEDVERRVEEHSTRAENVLAELTHTYPVVAEDTALLARLRSVIADIQQTMQQIREVAESYEAGRTQLVNLAGLGLMVEVVAHELSRATDHALRVLAAERAGAQPPHGAERLGTLDLQLRTLQKRLRILDPLATASRQVKEVFGVTGWVREIVDTHREQFARHRVAVAIRVVRTETASDLRVKAVKGMFVQVLENLISNSVYWLKQQAILDPDLRPTIEIVIDAGLKELRLSDNGPGIDPDRAEEVFQPFVTSKPPGEGKGLGLFISREIATYHGCSLRLAREVTSEQTRLHTFVLTLERLIA